MCAPAHTQQRHMLILLTWKRSAQSKSSLTCDSLQNLRTPSAGSVKAHRCSASQRRNALWPTSGAMSPPDTLSCGGQCTELSVRQPLHVKLPLRLMLLLQRSA